MITMDGKYQTRDGRSVRLIAIDQEFTQPVVGIVEGKKYACQWFLDGRYTTLSCPGDLIPIPEPPKYIPFTLSDWKQFIGKVVVSKNGEWIRTLDNASRDYATGMLYSSLFTDYTFEDGSVVGKLA